VSLLIPIDLAQFFALDEGAYSSQLNTQLIKNFLQFDASTSPLTLTSWTIVVPAYLLSLLGIDALAAVRVVSCTYGVLSTILFCHFVESLLDGDSQKRKYINQNIRHAAYFSIFVFAFLPSRFIWSTLALRESATEFWTLVILFLVYRLIDNASNGYQLQTLTLLCISTIFLFGSRFQIAIILISLIVIISIRLIMLKKQPKSLIVFISLGIMLGVLMSPLRSSLYSLNVFSSIIDSRHNASGKEPEVSGKEPEVSGKEPEVSGQDPISNFISNSSDRIIRRVNVNAIGADSEFALLKCEQEIAMQSKFLCILSSLPFRIFSITSRPLPYLDHGSRQFQLASFENIFWLLLFFSAFCRATFIVARREVHEMELLLCAFILCFILSLTFYEGNLGTAFRHKSLILAPTLLFILLHKKKEINQILK
jgi:hypothetical protein